MAQSFLPHDQLWEAEQPWEADQPGEADQLRAAAKIQRNYIYLFDLDLETPVCEIYPLLSSGSFKVLMPQQHGKQKTTAIVDNPAWSVTFGKDVLPAQLLAPSSYSRNNILVLSKHQQQFYEYRAKSELSFTPSAQVTAALRETLGLQFLQMSFEAGKKRSKSGENAFLLIPELLHD